MPRLSRRLSGLAAILGALLLLHVELACARKTSLPAGPGKRALDSVVWKAEASTSPRQYAVSVREEMLKDVVLRVLPGRSRAEIEDLLGPPLETPYFKGLGHDLIYFMGPERGGGISIDSEWLLVWLDKSGRIPRYRIVTD